LFFLGKCSTVNPQGSHLTRKLLAPKALTLRRPSSKASYSVVLLVHFVGVLDRQTYQGGTRGSRLCGEDCDRETEISKVCARTRDTRFI
jgi:hypothetical protein